MTGGGDQEKQAIDYEKGSGQKKTVKRDRSSSAKRCQKKKRPRHKKTVPDEKREIVDRGIHEEENARQETHKERNDVTGKEEPRAWPQSAAHNELADKFRNCSAMERDGLCRGQSTKLRQGKGKNQPCATVLFCQEAGTLRGPCSSHGRIVTQLHRRRRGTGREKKGRPDTIIESPSVGGRSCST